ncbi:MAG: hypothetical protein QM752_06975 [Gammaproteobacteria bacterium]
MVFFSSRNPIEKKRKNINSTTKNDTQVLRKAYQQSAELYKLTIETFKEWLSTCTDPYEKEQLNYKIQQHYYRLAITQHNQANLEPKDFDLLNQAANNFNNAIEQGFKDCPIGLYQYIVQGLNKCKKELKKIKKLAKEVQCFLSKCII